MRKDESRTDLGMIRIHKNVVASIASIAATEIEGVRRIGGDFKSTFLELISKKFVPRIKVDIDKSEEVRLEIPLVIKYGYNIPEVANKVQESVRAALEKMTTITIRDININVQGIEKGGLS
ncbi:MAG TPA: Asp23/Gls24 family envelope stress response protein [Patescibacteria group bacterium]|nr:Asp23/Gls24 family envelope stress response protein [Patescibacteria group bacterium]